MPADGADIPAAFRTSTYGYDLPASLIAQRPAPQRDQSRLLHLRRDGSLAHRAFVDLPQLLRPGDLLVANDAKVLRARFHARRSGGGSAEVLLLRPAATDDGWEALVRPGARVRTGDVLRLDADVAIRIVGDGSHRSRIVRFEGSDADTAMARFGQTPLPPYVRQPPPDADERYQTIYAAAPGSVAAPTAGLHFTAGVLAELARRGVEWATLTLDVGAGTFRPVRHADLREHAMHPERYLISERTATAIVAARRERRRVVAVGTTVLRALEDAAAIRTDGLVGPGERVTDVFIHPPYDFQIVDVMLTNFHLPHSTLLMLVAAFAGTDAVLNAYRAAVDERYHFFSFGDAMLVERP